MGFIDKWWKWTKNVVRHISLEPAYFGFALSYGLYGIVAAELYITKVCNVNFDFGKEICDNIQKHKDEQALVQKHVSTLRIYNSILQAVPSVIFTLFAGPWSDVYGRKVPIVVSTFGYCISNFVFMINTHFFYELKAEYLLFECLQDLTGGGVMFFMACNAYLADITNPKNRTKRVAFLSGCWPIGFNLGKALSGLIKNNLGFMYNFGFGMIVSVLTAFYVINFVPDSIPIRDARMRKEAQERAERKARGEVVAEEEEPPPRREKATKLSERVKHMFDLSNLKEGFKALATKRDHNMRTYIILMIFCFEMEQFINVGDWGNQYLYLRRKLDYTLEQFTVYTIVMGFIGISAQYITVPLFSAKFKLRDSTIVLIDIAGCFVQTILLCLAYAEWMIYLGMFIAFLDATSYAMIRCMISKNVRPDEVGKLLSVVGAMQAFIPMISSPIFSLIYRSTVDTLPETYLIVLAVCFVIDWIVLLIIDRGLRGVEKKRAAVAKDLEERAQEKLMEEEGEEEKMHLEESAMMHVETKS